MILTTTNLNQIFSKKLTEYGLVELQEIVELISEAYHKSKDRADRKVLKKKYEALAKYYNNEVGFKAYNDTL